MQRFIKSILTPTARSSAFYYFGNFAISFLRYLFHLLLLRLLLPADYGEFLAYLSLLYLLGIPNGTVSNVVIKYVAGFRGKKDNLSINELFYYLIEKLTPLSLGLGFLLIFFAKFLSIIFKAHPAAFVILGLYLFVSLVSTLVRSYLLAFQRFVAKNTSWFPGDHYYFDPRLPLHQPWSLGYRRGPGPNFGRSRQSGYLPGPHPESYLSGSASQPQALQVVFFYRLQFGERHRITLFDFNRYLARPLFLFRTRIRNLFFAFRHRPNDLLRSWSVDRPGSPGC